jgi:hypothetical protein
MIWQCNRQLTHQHPQDATNQQITETADMPRIDYVMPVPN